MPLTKEQIINAISLDVAGLNQAIKDGGYTDEAIKTVVFVGMLVDGTFMYDTTYDDDQSGEEELARIFCRYEKDIVTGKFVLIADF